MDKLSRTDPKEYQRQLKKEREKREIISTQISNKKIGKTVPCPYCHSWNTQKRAIAQRKIEIFLGEYEKQRHCNHCGSDF